MGWTALGYLAPLYSLYALLFLDTGLSEAQVSALFALWSVTGFLTEVPAGVLADRWSRRGSLVLGSCLEAAGFALWTTLPTLPAFAAGFLLWGLGGALHSGAAEALVYDGLAALGVEDAYPRVNGWISASQLVAQLPEAAAAAGLFALGGYRLVGWVSVAVCLATAALALRFPEPPPTADDEADEGLRSGLATLRLPAVGLLVVALALVGGIDAIEEYFPVMAGAWGVPTAVVPLAVLVVPLSGALGAALGGRAGRLPARLLAALLGAAGLFLGVAALVARPLALGAVAVFYALYLAVLVVAEARLQDRLSGRYRATVTSVAALGIELTSLAVFAAWAVRGALAIAVLVLVVALALATALHPRTPDRGRGPAQPSTG